MTGEFEVNLEMGCNCGVAHSNDISENCPVDIFSMVTHVGVV